MQASGLTNVIAIATGMGHCLALKSDGTVWGWGANNCGQLPGASSSNQATPIKLTGMPANIVSIGCGGMDNSMANEHSYAIDADGNVWTWGYNGFGQLGLGNTTNYSTPQKVPGINVLATGWNDRDTFINFTGQHRCYVDGYVWKDMPALEGLVVVTDKDEYKTPTAMGSDAMRTIEALPLVSLSSKPRDKRAFGVVAFEINDPSQRITYLEKLAEIAGGDVRAEINSVGEGCVWVTDADGPLEAGDYMTTSVVPGYASRQNGADGHAEGFLMNYTVAKITMDCDFDPPDVPHMVPKKDADGTPVLTADGLPDFEVQLENVFETTYYVDGVAATQAEYAAAQALDPATVRLETAQAFDVEYYVGADQVTKDVYDATPDTDAAGVATVASGATGATCAWPGAAAKSTRRIAVTRPVLQPKYMVRWVRADGTVITKAQYDAAMATAGSASAYRAAFVGCTYHCG